MSDKTQQFEAMPRMMPVLVPPRLRSFWNIQDRVLDTMENA